MAKKRKLNDFAKSFTELADTNVQFKNLNKTAEVESSELCSTYVSAVNTSVKSNILEPERIDGVTAFESFEPLENKPIKYDDTCDLQTEVKKLYEEKSDLIDQLDKYIEDNKKLIDANAKLTEENKKLQFIVSEANLQIVSLKNELDRLNKADKSKNTTPQIQQHKINYNVNKLQSAVKSLNGYSDWA